MPSPAWKSRRCVLYCRLVRYLKLIAQTALASPAFTASSHAAFLTSLSAPPKNAPPGSPSPPVDILLTHAWPAGITAHSSTPPSDPDAATFGAPAIAEIVAAARPRYHFATAQALFYEREPFAWPAEPTAITRFFGLGDFANAEKQRWFYAFSITPGAAASTPAPANLTACPIALPRARGTKRTKAAADQTGMGSFIFDDGVRGGAYEDRGGKRRKGKGRGAKEPMGEIRPEEVRSSFCLFEPDTVADDVQCYFCTFGLLARFDALGKHSRRSRQSQAHEAPHRLDRDRGVLTLVSLCCIVRPCTQVYVTLPVGQVPDTAQRNTPVPGGGHVLIIPVRSFRTIRLA